MMADAGNVCQDSVHAAGAQGGTRKWRPRCQLQGHTASPTFGDRKAAPMRRAVFAKTCRERQRLCLKDTSRLEAPMGCLRLHVDL